MVYYRGLPIGLDLIGRERRPRTYASAPTRARGRKKKKKKPQAGGCFYIRVK